MKCLCIGICQLGAIVEYLRRSKVFSQTYNEIVYYPVFDISIDKMKSILDNELPNSDLVLSQPVSSSYKNDDIFSTKKLRELCIKYNKKHYVIANCYFTGYDPMPFQTTDKEGGIIHYKNISYYPSSSLSQLLDGDIRTACIKWNAPDLYSKRELELNYARSIDELKRREFKIFDNDFGIDITISDYIESEYKKVLLFHTYNHPTNVLIYELFKRILIKLGLPIENIQFDHELLGSYSIPPPPSVYYGMGMTFSYPMFVLNGSKYGTKASMEIYSDSLRDTEVELRNVWKSSIAWSREKLQNVS